MLKTGGRSKRENRITQVLRVVWGIEPRLLLLTLSDLFQHDEYMRLYLAGLDASPSVESQVRLEAGERFYVVDLVIRIPGKLCIYTEVKIDSGAGRCKGAKEETVHQLSAYMKLLESEQDFEHRYLLCLTRRTLNLPAGLRDHPRVLNLRWHRIFELTLRYLHRDLGGDDESAGVLIVSHFLEYLEEMGLSRRFPESKSAKADAVQRYRSLLRETSRAWGLPCPDGLPDAILNVEGKAISVETNPGFDVVREDIRFMHKGRAIPISQDLACSIFQDIALAVAMAQADYLADGNRFPGALTASEVAKELNIHPSLVSRLVAGRMAFTPKGFLPLRSLLQLGIATRDGRISVSQLEDRIRHLISQENAETPLSDRDLKQHLAEEGILLSRRSVAKYRKRLGIPCFRVRTRSCRTGLAPVRPRILVVDDDQIVRRAVTDVLTPEGYAVSSVADGNEALELVRDRQFDLMFLDLKMPGPDGLEVLHQIKRISTAQVIIMTGYATIETAKSAITRGAENYVEKPLSPNRLRLLARGVLEGRDLRKEVVCPKVLVVDDDEIVLSAVRDTLRPAGFAVAIQQDPIAALALLREKDFNILIADLKMMQMDGMALIRAARELDPELICLIITGYPSIETAVCAMKEGVYDYITKPLHPGNLLSSVRRAWEKHRLSILNAQLLAGLRRKNEELARSRNKMAKIIQVMNDALFVTDLAGIVQTANPAAVRLLAREEGEILGEALRRFIAPEDSRGRSLLSAGRFGEIQGHVKVQFRGKDGPLPVVLSVSRLEFSGNPAGFVVVVQDLRDVTALIGHLDQMKRVVRTFAPVGAAQAKKRLCKKFD